MEELDKYYFSGIKPGDTIMGLKVIAVEGYEERIPPKEGELYKVITAYDKTFELYYGYYEDGDRENPLAEPMPIYPNFIENPVYTDEGIPFVTAMQDPCKHYKSKRGKKRDVDDTCADCIHYEKCDELLGICLCSKNKKPTDS